jgi:hypothetical protein
MTTTYYEHDFDSLNLMYSEVCNWFSALGFEYSKNRYGIYKRCFQKFMDLAEGKIVEKDLLGFKRSFDNAYIEVNEIIRIKNCLSNVDVSEFLDQVKKIISGQEFRGNTDNDQARDFLFELSIASRFIQAGYSVTLNGVCDVVVDLVDDGMLFVECKRVKSEAQLERNVKKANKQVLQRISSEISSKVHGLVAVNITDLLPKTNTFYPDSQSASTAIHRSVSNNYVNAKLERFSADSKNKCLGVMVESAKMNYLSDKSIKNGFFYSRHTEYLPYTESAVFKRLAPKLSNQDIIR